MFDLAKNTARSLLGEYAYESVAIWREHVANSARQRTLESKRSRKALAALGNLYANKRCFVIGNGPSLKDVDLTKLRDEVTIASNGLFLIFGEMGFAPTFYTIEDRLVASERSREANAIVGSTKIYPADFRQVFEDSQSTIWLNFRRAYRPFPQFSEKLDRVAYWGGTVSFLNLQIAFWLGCPEVYLIGFDHNYVIPPDAEIAGKVITSQSNDPNHFHPDYFGKGYRWHDPNVGRMESAYRVAKDHFEKAGRRISNATAGGRLEVFPRQSYDSLF